MTHGWGLAKQKKLFSGQVASHKCFENEYLIQLGNRNNGLAPLQIKQIKNVFQTERIFLALGVFLPKNIRKYETKYPYKISEKLFFL